LQCGQGLGADQVYLNPQCLTGRHFRPGGGKSLLGFIDIEAAPALQAGDRVPLDTERGYHAEWDMAEPLLQRPVCPTARGFYFCPMAGRLRVAGTVELGGLHLPPSAHRVQKLVEGARAFFPHLGEPDRSWMGFRPSLPDSLPVIGPSRAGPDIIPAFGHGHLGVTLAPITAQIVTALVAGKPLPLDIAAYRPGRF
ncbi:MAG: FAD-binding oxidoreductase, partial [Rhodobacterales bacterium]